MKELKLLVRHTTELQKRAFKRVSAMQGLYQRLSGCSKSTQSRIQISSAPRAVIKRATGLNDLYCHIGAFIMTLDRRRRRPPPPPPPPPPPLLDS